MMNQCASYSHQDENYNLTPDILTMLIQASEDENLQVIESEKKKGSLVSGGFSLMGGLVGASAKIGSGIGSIIPGRKSQKCISAADIVIDMTASQKRRLVNNVIGAFLDLGYEASAINRSLLHNPVMQTVALRELKKFLTKEGYSLKD